MCVCLSMCMCMCVCVRLSVCIIDGRIATGCWPSSTMFAHADTYAHNLTHNTHCIATSFSPPPNYAWGFHFVKFRCAVNVCRQTVSLMRCHTTSLVWIHVIHTQLLIYAHTHTNVLCTHAFSARFLCVWTNQLDFGQKLRYYADTKWSVCVRLACMCEHKHSVRQKKKKKGQTLV